MIVIAARLFPLHVLFMERDVSPVFGLTG